MDIRRKAAERVNLAKLPAPMAERFSPDDLDTMIPRFFIDRPIAAFVISFVMVLLGVLSLTGMPIAQYPDVVPPQVVVTAVYPGANAKVVSETVAAPLELEINGVENMLYMESQCTNDGAMRLTVTFKHGTNPDQAQVLVQNRVAVATRNSPKMSVASAS